MEIASEFNSVAPALPRVGVPDFDHGVPRMHGSGGESVSDSAITLYREPRRAGCRRTAETNSRDSQLTNDVVYAVILRSSIHRQPRNRGGHRVDLVARKDVVPGNRRLLRKIVEVGPEPRQVFRRGSHA